MKHEEIYRIQTGKDATGLDNNGIEFYYDNYLKWLEKQLNISGVYCGLPSKKERVAYAEQVASKHGVTEVFKKETLIKGFHLGFRYAKSFIKKS